MTQYRLLERNVDTIKDTDEFWDEMKRQWSAVPGHLIGQPFVGTIPYRRAIPEPEPAKQEPTIDPGEGWRLVRDDEIVLPTDERRFMNNLSGNWSLVTLGTSLRSLIEEKVTTCEQIRTRPIWKSVVFRRRATKKIVLKEWLCWENADPQCVWSAWCTQSPAEPCETQESWDNAIPTGQEREIEVPV